MKLYTEKVKNYHNKGALKNRKRGKSVEYFALAVLKFYYPTKFANAIKAEEPDIQSEGLGVEVTQLCSPIQRELDGAFSDLTNEENSEKSLSTFEKLGKKGKQGALHIHNGFFSMCTGGGIENFVSTGVTNAIDSKISKIDQYRKKVKGRLELAIVQTDLQPSNFESLVVDKVKSYTTHGCDFQTIYVISTDFVWSFDTDTKAEKRDEIKPDQKAAFSKIARMTAEEILEIDSEEWN